MSLTSVGETATYHSIVKLRESRSRALGHDGVALPLVERERLALEAETLIRLEVAALLHDLGRVAISNAVWEKPGPLTIGEREQVRLHPYYSERILSCATVLEPMAALAGLHHERLDGSGYHRGCSAAQLPPAARLLAAADAFQAMTQARPHRDPVSRSTRQPSDFAARPSRDRSTPTRSRPSSKPPAETPA